jgi:hypothetical protein
MIIPCPKARLAILIDIFFCRLKINHDSHEFILEFGTSRTGSLIGAQTKRPETKRPWTKRPWGQNFRGDKTSVATKCPSDKTFVGTKGPSDKMSGGQNVHEDKTSVGTKHPWTKRPSGSSLPGPCEAKFFTDKNLLSVKERSAYTHTLSLVSVFEVLYIYQNCLHPYYDIIMMNYT